MLVYLIIILELVGPMPVASFDTMAECRAALVNYGKPAGCVRQDDVNAFYKKVEEDLR